jgi:hypothetical protein
MSILMHLTFAALIAEIGPQNKTILNSVFQALKRYYKIGGFQVK